MAIDDLPSRAPPYLTWLYRKFRAACGRPYSPSHPPTVRRIPWARREKKRHLFEFNVWVPPWVRFMPPQSLPPISYSYPKKDVSKSKPNKEQVRKSVRFEKAKVLPSITDSGGSFPSLHRSNQTEESLDSGTSSSPKTSQDPKEASRLQASQSKGILRRSSISHSIRWKSTQVNPLEDTSSTACLKRSHSRVKAERHVTWSDFKGATTTTRVAQNSVQEAGQRPQYMYVSEAICNARLIDSATLDARFRSVQPEEISPLAWMVKPTEKSPVYDCESPLPQSPPATLPVKTESIGRPSQCLPRASPTRSGHEPSVDARSLIKISTDADKLLSYRSVHSRIGIRTFFPYGDMDPVKTAHGKTMHMSTGGSGMGTVMRLREPPYPLVVAATRHQSSQINDDLIARESRALQAVQDHPSFPKLYGVMIGRHLSVIIEFVGHQQTLTSLSVPCAVRLKNERVPLQEWVLVAVDVARGLDHLHSRGYVHCNLQPDHVLLWRDRQRWRAKIANLAGALEMDRARSATRDFDCKPCERHRFYPHLAPEVLAEGKGFTVRGDVYSLGSLLQEIAGVSHLELKIGALGRQCCSEIPEHRPSLSEVTNKLMTWACQTV